LVASESNLHKLRELTNNLPKLPEKLPHLVDMIEHLSSQNIRYKVENGECLGMCLFNNESVAVQHACLTAGTIFPWHIHEHNSEWIIIYSGKLREILKSGKSFEIGPGGYVFCRAGEEHMQIAIEDTRLIAITIPASEGYPTMERDK
jgi:quercetin dioxygenase-like cupin family protein